MLAIAQERSKQLTGKRKLEASLRLGCRRRDHRSYQAGRGGTRRGAGPAQSTSAGDNEKMKDRA